MTAAAPPPRFALPAVPAGTGVLLVRAAGVVDGCGVAIAPGSLLLSFSPKAADSRAVPLGCWRAEVTVLAVGSPDQITSHPRAAAALVADLPDSILIPGLVNAHTHLDLSHIGPRPFDPEDGFMGWIDMVRRGRATDPEAIGAAVRRGIQLSLGGGVVAVGDIAGAPVGIPSLVPYRVLADSALRGVSFLEFFAIGKGEARGRERAEAALREAGAAAGGSVGLGLQPHAPNTVAPNAYRWAVDEAARAGYPLATHLAETIDEREFVATGRGKQRELLETLGLWDDSVARAVGVGLSPVVHLRSELARAKFVLAHVNDARDEDIALLSATGQSVAYCPRAAAYFGNPTRLGPHRYRDMLAAGVNVALGTDSIVNLPPGTGAPGAESMSVLDEMRLLFRRDGADASELLRMGTVNGGRALGLADSAFAFSPGSTPAGIVAVDAGRSAAANAAPTAAVLASDAFPRLLILGN